MSIITQKQKLDVLQPQEIRKNKYKIWFSRWNRTLAAISAFIIFCALVIFIIVNIKTNNYNNYEDNATKIEDFFKMYRKDFKKVVVYEDRPNSCSISGNTINCSNMKYEDLCDGINSYNKTGEITVNLNNIKFSNPVSQGWLKCVIADIKDLTISGNISPIMIQKAFSGSPFENLQTLNLKNVSTNFMKKMFEDCHIKTLQIECIDSIQFEENVFGAIANSLKTLQIQRCIKQFEEENLLKNLTGSSTILKNLGTLDLSYNILRKIENTSFSSAPSLEVLFLSFCQITEISKGTFDRQFLNKLDLSNNALKTLQDGTFDKANGITITNNSWQCDCDLVWLQKLTDSNKDKFTEENMFECSTEDGKKPYGEVDFCPDSTTQSTSTFPSSSSSTSSSTDSKTSTETTSSSYSTSSSSSTTSITTSKSTTEATTTPSSTTTTSQTTSRTTSMTTTEIPTTEAPTKTPTRETPTEAPTTETTTESTTETPFIPSTITVECDNTFENKNIALYADNLVTLEITNYNVTMEFQLSAENNLTVLIETGANLDNDCLLWFQPDNKQNISCTKNITNNSVFYINNFHPNETYIFCLMGCHESTVSPLNCSAIAIPNLNLSDDYPTLIPKASLVPLLSIFCGSVIAGALITGFVVFYCIRQNPKLIKGNKRVIIVESEAADAIVMPPTYYDEVAYSPPSLRSYSNGYLTPKYKYYRRPRCEARLRTISQNVPYVRPSTSGHRFKTSFHARTSRMNLRQAYEEHMYEAPPLPPNHPSETTYFRIGRDSSRV